MDPMLTQMGMLLAASFRSAGLDTLAAMDPIERDFLAFWSREKEYDQMQQIGRLLGVMFNAGEVRKWSDEGGDAGQGAGMTDDESVLIPLSFMIRPESRESVKKMVGANGGMALPKEYKKTEGEHIVDLGKVSPEEFRAFVDANRVTTVRPKTSWEKAPDEK